MLHGATSMQQVLPSTSDLIISLQVSVAPRLQG